MKITAVMPVRNEDWCLGLSLRALLIWVDSVVVLLHSCEDESRRIAWEISTENPGRVTVLNRFDTEWSEMKHRQALLNQARRDGATHIVICDADEVLTANLLPGVRERIEQIDDRQVMEIPWLAVRPDWRYHTDGVWGASSVSTAFKDDPAWHWAARGDEQYDFHHRHPMGHDGNRTVWRAVTPGTGGLLHLQFLSDRRLRAKQALYQMTEVLRWPGRMTPDELSQMYGLAVYGHNRLFPSSGAMEPVKPEWLEGYQDLMRNHLHVDREPWQERRCHDLIAEHGREKFAGLDLFGVIE